MKDYYQDEKGTMLFTANGINCKCIPSTNENGLPSFEVVGYEDNDNISFRYAKGDIIQPEITSNIYGELLMSVEGNEADRWKSKLMTAVIVYGIVERLDRMSFITLKEVREGLNEKLQGKVNNDD